MKEGSGIGDTSIFVEKNPGLLVEAVSKILAKQTTNGKMYFPVAHLVLNFTL